MPSPESGSAASIAPVARARLAELAGASPRLAVSGLLAGYGSTEILHGVDLLLGAGQSLCLIGPNGAGKSTVLNAVFGFADIRAGSVVIDGRDVTREGAQTRLKSARIAYVLQDSSVFPDLSVEQNLRLGGYLMPAAAASESVERIFERHPRIAQRREQPARVLSGGERRLLEIARALMMDPQLLLVDEPSIGLEPRYVDDVFEMLAEIKTRENKSILLVEQNARKGLGFADIGYVMAAGQVVLAATGEELLGDRTVARLFLGE